jgi:class 3 adenylate cyclase
MGDNCDLQVAVVAVPAVLAALLLVGLAVLLVRWYLRISRHRALLANMDWKVDWNDVYFSSQDMEVSQKLESMVFHSSVSVNQGQRWGTEGTLGKYKGGLVMVERINTKSVDLDLAFRKEIRDVREVHHTNLHAFIGACVEPPNVAVLREYCQKGTLDDILANPDVRLDETFKFSILKDIAAGMRFLHQSVFQWHGRLTTNNCFVDNRWTVKVGGFGLHSLYSSQEDDLEAGEGSNFGSLRWTAPEILESGVQRLSDIALSTPAADVYSFGVVMSEVWTREQPYDDLGLTDEEIIHAISRRKMLGAAQMPVVKQAWAIQGATVTSSSTDTAALRPTITPDTPIPLRELMVACWDQNPDARPNFRDVCRSLDTIHPTKGSMVDNLISMLEKYSEELEAIVAERTKELAQEKEKVESLVYRMLPRAVATKLKDGEGVKAESFDNVTIFFSDIVGFTRICSQSTPLQVVDMLNDLYTCFDTIIDEYDVYKVETIGDAYMVVSGLPTRNGNKHAGEIASMALHMLSAIIDFRIRHLPDERMQLRVGMHSGPVVAGVVGTKMPRYCLFGDTVNIASRMESGGFALRIHLSETTGTLLKQLGGYHLEERGVRDVKGKGKMMTYWLNGKDGFTRQLPSDDMRVSASQHEFK